MEPRKFCLQSHFHLLGSEKLTLVTKFEIELFCHVVIISVQMRYYCKVTDDVQLFSTGIK